MQCQIQIGIGFVTQRCMCPIGAACCLSPPRRSGHGPDSRARAKFRAKSQMPGQGAKAKSQGQGPKIQAQAKSSTASARNAFDAIHSPEVSALHSKPVPCHQHEPLPQSSPARTPQHTTASLQITCLTRVDYPHALCAFEQLSITSSPCLVVTGGQSMSLCGPYCLASHRQQLRIFLGLLLTAASQPRGLRTQGRNLTM